MTQTEHGSMVCTLGIMNHDGPGSRGQGLTKIEYSRIGIREAGTLEKEGKMVMDRREDLRM